MPNLLTKSAISIATLGGLGGTGYGLYVIARTPTYAELLDGTLLSTNGNENQANWSARLTSLSKAEERTLINSLKEIKNKKTPVATWEDLKNWCKDNINKTNKGKEKVEFQNIQNYCTFSIKERLNKNIITGETSGTSNPWKASYEALKKISNNELDESLKDAKSKEETAATPLIKKWCEENVEKPYKGEKEQKFKNISTICIANS